MHDFLPFIIIGLTTGSVYGLAGTGLVLTYKTSGIFNFAYGSVAALAAFVFYYLRQQHHIPWPAALVLAGFVFAGALGLALEYLARSLAAADTTIKVVSTIGIVLIVLSIGALWFPGNARIVNPFLPTGHFSVGGTNVGYDQLIIFGISLGVAGVLYWILRFTRLGVAMRAVVDNPDLLSRTGVSPTAVRRSSWIIGTCLAAVSGILLAPSLNLDALVLTLLVVQAFGAAAIGSFTSLPWTFVGGLALGVAGALATKYTANYSFLAGLSPGLPFIVLFVVLIVTPRHRLAERAVKPIVEVHRSWFAPPLVRLAFATGAVGLLAAVPTFAGIHLAAYSSVLVTVILVLSLGLLVKTSGQVSLCHLGFAAVGATAMAHLTHSYGVPWLPGVLLGALIVVPVGAVVAIPAIRLSGVFLALATFGFGILLEQMFYPMRIMFGTASNGLSAPRPGGGIGHFWRFDTDQGFYYVLVIFVILTVAMLVAVHRGRLGRLLRAMGDSPLALQTHGATVNTTRVLVFCISAFFAGLSGALTASLWHFAVSTQYSSFQSLTLFAALVIVVLGEPWYALVVAAAMQLIPSYVHGSNTPTYLQLLFGVGAVLYVFAARHPLGVPSAVRHALERLGTRSKASPPTAAGVHPDGGNAEFPTLLDRNGAAPAELGVRSLTVRYGGVRAVNAVSLTARPGHITGLIGPNGAGKTTTFNACSGLVRPNEGTVTLAAIDITRTSPQQRARLGLGRTFQRVELFDSLTVEENVALGAEAFLAGAMPWRQIAATPSERRTVARAAEAAITLAGINALRRSQAGLLPSGQRRLVELAVTLAGPFDLLLLDEPSAGLDQAETRRFGQVLQQVVDARRTGILLVEHDMALVREVCDYLYVLDFGELIFEGTPDQMRRSDRVRAAYLGDDVDDATRRSHHRPSTPDRTTPTAMPEH